MPIPTMSRSAPPNNWLSTSTAGATLTGNPTKYNQLAANASKLGAGLHARGFGKGDVMAILAPNLPEYPIAFLGSVTMAARLALREGRIRTQVCSL